MPIELDHVSYSYPVSSGGTVTALRDINLKIGDGEFVGIAGRTGCGKTTLIQLIAGLLVPASGRILIDGQDINDKRYDRGVLRKNVGLVFQYPEYQLFETTVEKDVAFGLKHSGLAPLELKDNVKWALETVGFSFDDIRSHSPLSLSGGEKRRVAIAGVLACKPKILIFDEPIAGLDPRSRQSFLHTVSKQNLQGTTIIMVSHNADALAEYAGRLLIIDNGVRAACGTVKEIFSDIDKLASIRLQASTPRLIGNLLSHRGIPVPDSVTSYNELLSFLTSRLKGGAPQ